MKPRISPLMLAGLLAIGGVDAWLAAVAIQTVAIDDEAPAGKFAWTPKLATATGGVPKQAPIDAYHQILARPVFSKTRQPFVAPPPPPPPPPQANVPIPPAPDPGLALGGITIARDLRKAYLFSRIDPKGVWVSEGESFMGWKVEAVGNTSARLQQQGRTVELELYVPASTGASPSISTPPASPAAAPRVMPWASR